MYILVQSLLLCSFIEKIVLKKNESFFIGIFRTNLEKSTWHYHNNFEISFITEGSGKRLLVILSKNFNQVIWHLSVVIFHMYG